MVLADDAIDDILDLRNLIGRHRFGMAEVEAQTLRRHHRAFLRDMRAEYAAQGFMQKMRRRMVRPRRRAARTIDLHFDDIADLERAMRQLAEMDNHIAELLECIGNRKFGASSREQHTRIANLPARLSVERR